jgi:hypothetical protein
MPHRANIAKGVKKYHKKYHPNTHFVLVSIHPKAQVEVQPVSTPRAGCKKRAVQVKRLTGEL